MWGAMAPPGSFAVMKEGNPEESSAWGGGGVKMTWLKPRSWGPWELDTSHQCPQDQLSGQEPRTDWWLL